MVADRSGSSVVAAEVSSQPACWRQAADAAPGAALPAAGERVALVGCGTSLYVAQAVAAWRESAGQGISDAFAASEMPLHRTYDVVVAVSRSGTTTEVRRLVESLPPGADVLAITATGGPIADVAKRSVALPFADERAVVQTRFATSVMAMWRAHLGHDVAALADAAELSLKAALPGGLEDHVQFVFLGTGAGVGLANEAALKFREAALAWTEAYPAMELRHGPISLLEQHSLVWALTALPDGLAGEILSSGASLEQGEVDPMVGLVRVHRAAIALAASKGLDPSQPRRLARSVVLP
jgi:fructoselysine-6-P-deglycase FrlB-like protein